MRRVTIAQEVEAVFENGKFRPLKPPAVSLTEGQRVRLTVESETAPNDVIALAGRVYAGLPEEEIDEVERIALDRRPLFDDPGP